MPAKVKKPTFIDDKNAQLFSDFTNTNAVLESFYQKNFNRSLPINELYNDRWKRAKHLGFGNGSNIYDSSYIFGDVNIGENCWIGMFTIIDGSGKLTIGNNCTISAGVHIYTHDNIKSTLNPLLAIEKDSVEIGNNCYIGPNSILTKGVKLKDFCVVAANSFVKDSFESNSIIAGSPAKKIGNVVFENDTIKFDYSK